MRKVMQRLIIALTVLVMCCPAAAFAAEAAQTPQVEIPVKITLEGTLPDPAEKFTVQLKGDSADVPMPQDAVDGVSTLTITGAGTKSFAPIVYDRVGVYNYTVSQVAGKNADCTYDKSVYHVTVYITNAETGGLEATVVAYEDDENQKQDIVLNNVYKVVPPTTEPPTTEAPDPVLPQTGQINWPIPVMLVAGLFMLGAGAALCFRKEKTTGEE